MTSFCYFSRLCHFLYPHPHFSPASLLSRHVAWADSDSGRDRMDGQGQAARPCYHHHRADMTVATGWFADIHKHGKLRSLACMSLLPCEYIPVLDIPMPPAWHCAENMKTPGEENTAMPTYSSPPCHACQATPLITCPSPPFTPPNTNQALPSNFFPPSPPSLTPPKTHLPSLPSPFCALHLLHMVVVHWRGGFFYHHHTLPAVFVVGLRWCCCTCAWHSSLTRGMARHGILVD